MWKFICGEGSQDILWTPLGVNYRDCLRQHHRTLFWWQLGGPEWWKSESRFDKLKPGRWKIKSIRHFQAGSDGGWEKFHLLQRAKERTTLHKEVTALSKDWIWILWPQNLPIFLWPISTLKYCLLPSLQDTAPISIWGPKGQEGAETLLPTSMHSQSHMSQKLILE